MKILYFSSYPDHSRTLADVSQSGADSGPDIWLPAWGRPFCSLVAKPSYAWNVRGSCTTRLVKLVLSTDGFLTLVSRFTFLAKFRQNPSGFKLGVLFCYLNLNLLTTTTTPLYSYLGWTSDRIKEGSSLWQQQRCPTGLCWCISCMAWLRLLIPSLPSRFRTPQLLTLTLPKFNSTKNGSTDRWTECLFKI